MIKKTFRLLPLLFIIFFLVPLIAGAGALTGALTDPLGGQTFGQVIEKIARTVARVLIPAGGIMIIISGILFLLSAGNPGLLSKAKICFIYAAVGLVIGAAAGGLVRIVQNLIK